MPVATMSGPVSALGAVLAGLLSFLSPCVLPLVPAYLSFLTGLSVEEMRQANAGFGGTRLLAAAAVFVGGFSLVFIMLGASASLLGHWLLAHFHLLGVIAGGLLVLLGLHTTGLVRLRFLMMEKRWLPESKPLGLLGSFLVGIAFAFGWTPCVGPILAGILALAGSQGTVARGVVLLACYSAGLGIPFLLAALALERFIQSWHRWARLLHWVEIVSGVLLMALGLAMMANLLGRLSAWVGALKLFSL
jgi:cytochrome c-type biogenesis protein